MAIARSAVVAALIGALAVGAAARAGDDWDTDCTTDAGSFPFSAQPVAIAGFLGSIRGCLSSGPLAGADFEDMYVIQIVDPAGFSAQTVAPNSTFNTQLWLFSIDGTGLLANDDVSVGDPLSRLLPMSNDGSGAQVSVPGNYLLAITGFNNDPSSDEGPIFNVPDQTEISGPDGPGGLSPITAWNEFGETGDYLIVLTGCAGVGAPTSVPLMSTPVTAALIGAFVVGGGMLLRRRAIA
ncbi:MAG: hypothetical protein KDA25_07055 [Phycisphaerales bacterium]|nr:hypothetical protein [Phycisphaerales bacterium]